MRVVRLSTGWPEKVGSVWKCLSNVEWGSERCPCTRRSAVISFLTPTILWFCECDWAAGACRSTEFTAGGFVPTPVPSQRLPCSLCCHSRGAIPTHTCPADPQRLISLLDYLLSQKGIPGIVSGLHSISWLAHCAPRSSWGWQFQGHSYSGDRGWGLGNAVTPSPGHGFASLPAQCPHSQQREG